MNYKVVLYLLMLLIVGVFIMNYKIYIVSGNSMKPTLKNQQVVIGTTKLDKLTTGDIVVVDINDELYIKRIVAQNGDFVECTNNTLEVNGSKLSEYYCMEQATINLESNEYFVLGDNADVSIDSRDFGVVLKNEIKAKIFGG